MRKIIVLAAIAVIAATTAVWSIVTFAKPKAAFHVQSTEELAPVSPREIMIKQGRTLPVDVLTFLYRRPGVRTGYLAV